MKQSSYGWPLLFSGAGTLLSLALPSKRGHVLFGALWAGFSALHAWQYRKKLQGTVPGGEAFLEKVERIMLPKSKLELFLRTVEVASYLPGRVRLYSRALAGCPPLAEETRARLAALSGVTGVEVNPVTGSVLVVYDPETLRHDPALGRAEEYLRTHAKRKG